MPPEFPSTARLMEKLVSYPTDAQTERGKKGTTEMLNYIRELVNVHNLGYCWLQPFGSTERQMHNAYIDVGRGSEVFLVQAHGDTINPYPFYNNSGVDPFRSSQVQGDDDIRNGCGCGEDKAGVVAALRSLPGLKDILESTDRRARILIDDDEEGQSRGINAAKEHIRGCAWAVTFEVRAGSKLDENPCIVYGRPGRMDFNVIVEGLRTEHIGQARSMFCSEYAHERTYRAARAIDKIDLDKLPDLPEQDDRDVIQMPPSRCQPYLYGMQDPNSMTVPRYGRINVQVIYTNAGLTEARIESEIRKAIETALGDTWFDVKKPPNRETDFLEPWKEDPDHPLVKSGLHHLEEIIGCPPELRYGGGTANECAIAHMGIPVITLPPNMEGEHGVGEKVRLSHIDDVMVPWLHKMAGSDRSHIHWQN